MFDKDNKFGFINNNESNNNIEGLDNIKTDIKNIKDDVGNEELTTTAKDLKGAINELDTQYKDIAKKVENGVDLTAYAKKTDIPDISTKVDKVEGKVLSTNDYTTAEKDKLASLKNCEDSKINLSDFIMPRYKTIENIGFIGRWFEKEINGVKHHYTINSGSEFYFKVNRTNSVTINFTKSSTNECYIAYSIDGNDFVRTPIGNGEVKIALNNTDEHKIRVVIDGIDQSENKWYEEKGVALKNVTIPIHIDADYEFTSDALGREDKYLFALFDLSTLEETTGKEKFSISYDICANVQYKDDLLFFGNNHSLAEGLDNFQDAWLATLKNGTDVDANVSTHTTLSNVVDYGKQYKYLRVGFKNSHTSYVEGTDLKMWIRNFTLKLGDIDITDKLVACDILNASTMKKNSEYHISSMTGLLPQNRVGLFFGDSITEGILALTSSPGADGMSAINAFPFTACKNLNAISHRVGFGGTGITTGGSGYVPELGAVVDKITNSRYVEDDCRIDFIVINSGTNDSKENEFKPKYNAVLDKLKLKYCGIPIFIMIPFNGTHSSQIKECIDDRSYC